MFQIGHAPMWIGKKKRMKYWYTLFFVVVQLLSCVQLFVTP